MNYPAYVPRSQSEVAAYIHLVVSIAQDPNRGTRESTPADIPPALPSSLVRNAAYRTNVSSKRLFSLIESTYRSMRPQSSYQLVVLNNTILHHDDTLSLLLSGMTHWPRLRPTDPLTGNALHDNVTVLLAQLVEIHRCSEALRNLVVLAERQKLVNVEPPKNKRETHVHPSLANLSSEEFGQLAREFHMKNSRD